MQPPTNRSRFRPGFGCAIALIVLLVMGGISVGGYFWARGYFARQYYEQFYAPDWLQAPVQAAQPASVLLDDVPWLASDQALSPSLSMQMLAQQRGLEVTRRQVDFLMGFTYGASSQDGGVAWLPNIDPELGYLTAAPCLGLTRHYQVANDEAHYLAALRGELAQGNAVRVALDRAALYGQGVAVAHSIVLVGYDSAGFRFYEPVCDGVAPCEQQSQSVGVQGLYLDETTLLAAVGSLAKVTRTPWRYNMMTVTLSASVSCDERTIWRRNGQIMRGSDEQGEIRGAEVIARAAKVLAQRGTKVDQAALSRSLALTAYARQEDAAYLSEQWPNEREAGAAVEHLLHAAALYDQCYQALEDGLASNAEAYELALVLRQAAQAERQAGEAMIAMASE